MTITSSPIKIGQLNKKNLLDLISGKILALRVYPFISIETCIEWQKQIAKSKLMGRYSNALDIPVNRIGMTLFETGNDHKKLKLYFKKAKETLPSMERIFGERNPIQVLLSGLDTAWASGVVISQLYGQAMNPGIIRSFESDKAGGLPAHVDSLSKDLPDSDEFIDIRGQLAANLYFSVSSKGGELELWDYAPDADELEYLFTGDYDFIDTNKLPVSSQKLGPKVGELILFRSNCVHSVAAGEGGMRSAASCFIGYYGAYQPLTVWA